MVIDEENWKSFFSAMKRVIDHYPSIQSTVQKCIEDGIIAKDEPLSECDFVTDWEPILRDVYQNLHVLASFSSPSEPNDVHRYLFYTTVVNLLHSIDSCYLSADARSFIHSVLSDFIKGYFDNAWICMDSVFTTTDISSHCSIDSFQKALQGIIQNQENQENQENQDNQDNQDNQENQENQLDLEKIMNEFQNYCKETFLHTDIVSLQQFWNTDGLVQYPNLAKLATIVLAYPCTIEMHKRYSSIKNYIHSHVRNKKEMEGTNAKSMDELFISCNRHLVVRWNLDYQ